MSGSCFAERLGQVVELSATEIAALERIEQRKRLLRKGAILVRENDPFGEMYVLRSGMMMSYVVLADGSRQIPGFLFPGDLLGASALVYRHSPETVAAVTDCTVMPIERSAMAALTLTHPRLSALLLVIGQIERAALTDRLAGLGRTSAKARIAALLIDLRNGLRMTDPTIDTSFPLSLTQEEIGDATGLTAVHVNRMLRQLEEEGMIARASGQLTLLDERALKRRANYVDRSAGLDLSWLPAAG